MLLSARKNKQQKYQLKILISYFEHILSPQLIKIFFKPPFFKKNVYCFLIRLINLTVMVFFIFVFLLTASHTCKYWFFSKSCRQSRWEKDITNLRHSCNVLQCMLNHHSCYYLHNHTFIFQLEHLQSSSTFILSIQFDLPSNVAFHAHLN